MPPIPVFDWLSPCAQDGRSQLAQHLRRTATAAAGQGVVRTSPVPARAAAPADRAGSAPRVASVAPVLRSAIIGALFVTGAGSPIREDDDSLAPEYCLVIFLSLLVASLLINILGAWMNRATDWLDGATAAFNRTPAPTSQPSPGPGPSARGPRRTNGLAAGRNASLCAGGFGGPLSAEHCILRCVLSLHCPRGSRRSHYGAVVRDRGAFVWRSVSPC